MKKLLFWIVLIVGIVAMISSCKKDDDSTTAAAAAPAGGTGTTASGTIAGSNSDLTGTFHASWYGQEPDGGCIDNSTAISAHSFPSETKGFKKELIITGTSTFTKSLVSYSDATCSTMTSYFNQMKKTVTIGSEISSLTAGSSPAKPTTANKISYIAEKYSLMANTTAMIAFFLSQYESSVDSGIELLIDAEASETTEYNLIATGTVSGSTYLFLGNKSSADNKTDWGSSSTFWQ